MEYLFGALYKVLYAYDLPVFVRYPLAALILASYIAIEVFLVHEAVRCFGEGKTYLMWLCVIGAVLFAVLAVVGVVSQRSKRRGV